MSRDDWEKFFDDVDNPGSTPTLAFPGTRPPVPPVSKTRRPVHEPLSDDWIRDFTARRYRRRDGTVGEFYPIRVLAAALNRRVVTVRTWERAGWLPEARFRTPPSAGGMAGHRLYSKEFISRLQVIAEEERVLVPGSDIVSTDFTRRAHELMEEVGE